MANDGSKGKSRVMLWGGLLLAAAVATVFFPLFHVVSLDELRQQAAAVDFDAATFVEEFWNEQLLPAEDGAVDAGELIAALAADSSAAAERYGHRLGLSGRASYLVSGDGSVTATDGRRVELSLPEGGKIVITTGPVFGNAVRDGSGLLDVSDFKNTQEFNAVSSEINRRIESQVLPKLEEVSVGTSVRVFGAVEVSDSDSDLDTLQLTPVVIEIP
jgi:predicted lipoprotein